MSIKSFPSSSLSNSTVEGILDIQIDRSPLEDHFTWLVIQQVATLGSMTGMSDGFGR